MMEREFFIHGTPSTHESTGKDVFDGFGRKYSEEYWNGGQRPAAPRCLAYETRRWKGVLYSVYTYYVSGRDVAGRSKSYCALTLMLQGVETRVSFIYRILETAYKSLQTKYKYIDLTDKFLVNTFDGKDGIGAMRTRVLEQVDQLACDKLDPNTDAISDVDNSTAQNFNPVDMDTKEFLSAIRNDGKLLVNPEAPTLALLVASSISKKPEVVKEKSRGTSVHHSDQGNELDSLKEEIEQLQDLVKNGKAPADGNFGARVRFIDWFNLVNFILLLCILVGGILSRCSQKGVAIAGDKENAFLVKRCDSLQSVIRSIAKFSSARIDIVDGGNLIKTNKPYQLNVIGADGIESKDCEWRIAEGLGTVKDGILQCDTTGTVLIDYSYKGIRVLYRSLTVE